MLYNKSMFNNLSQRLTAIIKNLSLEDSKKFQMILESKKNQALEKEQSLLIEKIKKMFVIDLPFEMSQVPTAVLASLNGMAIILISVQMDYLILSLLLDLDFSRLFISNIMSLVFALWYAFEGLHQFNDEIVTQTKIFKSILAGSHLLLTTLVGSILFSS